VAEVMSCHLDSHGSVTTETFTSHYLLPVTLVAIL